MTRRGALTPLTPIYNPLKRRGGIEVGTTPGTAPSPGFFGLLDGMLREFWAEDPLWTNPGEGNLVTGWRDNGSIALDLVVVADAGAANSDKPIYVGSLIGGKPGVEFRASAPSTGAGLEAGILVNAPHSVVVVARIDNLGGGWFPYMVDSTAGGRAIIGIGAVSATTKWSGYHNVQLFCEAGAWDTANHLFVLVVKANDTRLYIDGTQIASDLSGAADTTTGFIVGSGRLSALGTRLNGAIGYAAQYGGDITADADYAAWNAEIQTYYGI